MLRVKTKGDRTCLPRLALDFPSAVAAGAMVEDFVVVEFDFDRFIVGFDRLMMTALLAIASDLLTGQTLTGLQTIHPADRW